MKLKVGKLYRVVFATTPLSACGIAGNICINQDDVLIYLGQDALPLWLPRIMGIVFLTPNSSKIYFDEYSDVYNNSKHYFKEIQQ